MIHPIINLFSEYYPVIKSKSHPYLASSLFPSVMSVLMCELVLVIPRLGERTKSGHFSYLMYRSLRTMWIMFMVVIVFFLQLQMLNSFGFQPNAVARLVLETVLQSEFSFDEHHTLITLYPTSQPI